MAAWAGSGRRGDRPRALLRIRYLPAALERGRRLVVLARG